MRISPRFVCTAVLAVSGSAGLSAAPAVRGHALAPKGAPLSGARVELLDVRGGERARVAAATTDAHGRYLLTAPGPGVYRVRIAAAGGVPLQSRPLPLVEEVDLPPAAPPPSGAAVLLSEPRAFWSVASGGEAESPVGDPPARHRLPLSALVLATDSGRPIAGALVWSRADPSGFELTDVEGRFRIRLAAGRPARLEARAEGRLPKPFTPSPAQMETGRLHSLMLEPAATLGGRVVDSAGRGLAGAWVSASVQGREEVASGALSRGDGTFTLPTLRPGELYVLRAAKSGFLRARGKAVAPNPAGPQAQRPSRQVTVSLILLATRAAVGRVQDQEARALAGAEVRITEAMGAEARQRPMLRPERGEGEPQAVSAIDGRFRVAEIPALALDVAVTRPGFARVDLQSFKVPSGSGPVDLGTIRLLPAATLEGRVVDVEGRPVAGAAIFRVRHLLPPDELAEQLRELQSDATAGASGRFELTDLAKGSPIHLLVTARGFLPATARGVRPPTASPLIVRLEAGAPLAGRVLDEQENPVRGAEVEVAWYPRVPGREDLRAGPAVTKRTVSDRNGRFRVPDLRLGAVDLAVEAPGFVAVSGLPAAVPQRADEELTIRLERGAALEGRVVTSAGDPVADARILAGSAAGISDEEGLFRVAGIRPGPQLVEARHPHYEPLARRILIEPAGSRTEFVFPAGQEVHGRVVDAAGEPVAGAAVDLAAIAQRLPRRYRSRADADGIFLLSPVSRGTYRLQASADGQGEGELEPVEVGDEPVAGLTVVLQAGGTIRGRLHGLTPDELAQVVVGAARGTDRSRIAEVDAAGNYLLDHLPAGDWLVRASLGEGRRQAQARVPLPPSGDAVRDLDFGGRLTLSGVVIYRDQPLFDARVSLRGRQRAVNRSITTDHEGRFTFEELEPDTYQLGLTNGRELVAHNELIEVAADREVVIRIERTSVAGVILDAVTRKPVARALVVLRHAEVGETPEFMLAGGSDDDGRFQLHNVPPARYSMTVTKDGYAPAQRELEVTLESDTAGVDVRLEPSPGLVLEIRLASGSRPPMVHLRLVSLDGRVVLAGSELVGQDGRVRLATAPPGSWMLLAAGAGGALAATPVQVPGPPVPLVLSDPRRLVVRIEALAASDSIATLRLVGLDGRDLETLGAGGALHTSWPVVGGSAVVEGVPAGSWSVQVQAPDGSAWTGGLTTDGSSDVAIALD